MGIKKNFVFSSILTVSNFIFPLLVFPYVTRVLGVSNIGLCNFVDSIINYFILFSMLGISIIGIREVAKTKKNIEQLKKTFSSLFLLNVISTFVMLLILIVATIFVPKLFENKEMMLLGGIKLIFNLFLTEWFFKGLEDFKYITIRSVIIKSVFVISVFIFVRDQGDVQVYYALICGMVVLNAFINWNYRKRFISFSFKNVSFTTYVKPYFTMGSYMVLTSMYTSFNVAYLGFVSGNIEVGYYTTATKLYGVLLAFFTAFTAVMLPRMSALVAEGKIDEVKRLTARSYEALIAFSIPLIIISTIFAPQIIRLIAGPGYEGAILPMRIVMPLMLIIGIEQILIIQLLMPLKKDNIILINSIIGASVGILLNILLVSSLKSVGSSIVWICAEISVLIVAQYFVKKALNINFPLKKILLNFLYALPLATILLYLNTFKLTEFIILIMAAILSIIYVGLIQFFIIKNDFLLALVLKSNIAQFFHFSRSEKL